MKKAFLPIMAMVVLGSLLNGQSLDEVLDRYYRARGGLETLKSITGWKMTGTIDMTESGLKLPFALWQKTPGKMRVETMFQGNKTVQAFDGARAWWIVPTLSEAAQEMPREQGRQIADQADLENPLVVYREKGYPLELLGREDLDGTPVFKLKLTKTGGQVIHVFLDAEQGIELKSERAAQAGEGEGPIEIRYGDYRTVDGRLMPFAIENRIQGQVRMRLTVTAIEFNPELDDAFFAMPASQASPAAGNKQNP